MARVLVVLSLLAGPALAQECLVPEDVARLSGYVELTYRVSPTCEVSDVEIVRSDRPGAFDEAATCLVRARSRPDAPVAEVRVLTREEAEAELAKQRAANPDRYHLREIVVQLGDGASRTLRCFFDAGWRRTAVELAGEDADKPVITDPLQLPLQRRRVTFEGDSD
jgi:hypothetical protein